tara:strand:+ start:304 stop:906 length:603 start_codon:yes stop_codon:yes gene_type:complete
MTNIDDFNKCEKGHFYPKDQAVCPYCPKSGDSSDGAETEFIGDQEAPTELVNDEFMNEKTQIFDSNSPTVHMDDNVDTMKTIISGVTAESSESPVVNRRKLRGWLVTFDHAEFGLDFKIVEGRNLLGKQPSCDVTINDPEVTGQHAIILCQDDKFIISDEMSTNGTKLNDNKLIARKPESLSDGDVITLGTTNLLFKTAF